MKEHSGLGSYNIVGFVPIVDVERAKKFYMEKLGLRLVSEELPFALVFDANGIMLRLAIVAEIPPTPGTILGWQVTDVGSVVQTLAAEGVEFERYGFLEQDESGIWTAPNGTRIAWFKDPDGNTLSVSEHVS